MARTFYRKIYAGVLRWMLNCGLIAMYACREKKNRPKAAFFISASHSGGHLSLQAPTQW